LSLQLQDGGDELQVVGHALIEIRGTASAWALGQGLGLGAGLGEFSRPGRGRMPVMKWMATLRSCTKNARLVSRVQKSAFHAQGRTQSKRQ
jgi:hypothetical protein